MTDFPISAFDYPLPDDRIAAFPLAERDASRLLVWESGKISDRHFHNLAEELPGGATLVVNDTRVIEARIFFQKASGGIIELFLLEPQQPAEMTAALQSEGPVQWRCLIGGASKWKAGQVLTKTLTVQGADCVLEARFVSKEPDEFIVDLRWAPPLPFAEVLHAAGAIPLPPYIRRAAEGADAERYQTIFARQQGSVAAPTAALHFTPRVLEALEAKSIRRTPVTLNVGAGTFKPVKSDTIGGHPMHGEYFSVMASSLRELVDATRLVAVGTTSLRTLESLYWLGVKTAAAGMLQTELGQWEAYELETPFSYRDSLTVLLRELEKNGWNELHGRTSLLIRPGYRFQSAEALLTNFHQPKSTLVCLVAAFIGEDWRRVYTHALEQGYRFLSYGDSSLLWRKS
ncbi:S-adenosylmethionine:tRNA ribosyltransferase-isomerase [Flaviaesturariibacter aridisoli]|uniref:S-adenosylmethionine:tRNA ribosyltransferase-isomerase n=1 Tax=Flaviaesturariibacter aridisoli TaxID=2545761 RepID=A0A4R4E2U8_9BACT|nr:S-adenosylmethionine:tRNA ribosyltransferase-isomerase [Flaviaesturariibacter aridisoli]TCZ69925.1 S-adenosylmethionine:tRNA ribosyltransferase-isomerase [Flaviaesturariibacter aridisoli]